LILAFAVKTWVLDPTYNPSALSGLAMSSRIYVPLFSGTTLYLSEPTIPRPPCRLVDSLMVNDIVSWQKRVIEYAAGSLDFDFVTIAEDRFSWLLLTGQVIDPVCPRKVSR
jgi:hypothetical protein